jgi:membrane protein
MKTHLLIFWRSFLNSFKLFRKHDTLTLGAALSYYTGFSLIPIIIIVISIAGSILGPQAVQGEIKTQLESVMGTKVAAQLQDIIKVSYQPGTNGIAAFIAIILLLIGATSVFSQLHTSLDLIWNVKAKAKQPILQFFIKRIFSFAMIICISFLLLVSLIIHAALSLLTTYLNQHLPYSSVFVISTIDFLISYGFTTLLFALVYKYMSDANLRWRSVWPGALFTAALFELGKYLMGLYFGNFYLEDAYGTAGSVVLLLTWVFYSSQIVFFGAEFTHALSAEHGLLLDPKNISAKADADITPWPRTETAGPKQG